MIEEVIKSRHEYKYLCSARDICILEARLEHLLDNDPHVGHDGYYSIRSLYFDDYDNSCFYDNRDGVDNRKKYRIRIYNSNKSRISLECKEKIHGKTVKTACIISFDIADRLINTNPIDDNPSFPPLLRRLICLVQSSGLHPVIIVEYDRKPYIERAGNVRVTLDLNIRSSSYISDFWDSNLRCRPILETGKHLLEVKFDEFIPDYIRHNLQIDGLECTSFSKYCLCRTFC